MKRQNILPISLILFFFLMLFGYKYSLLHDASQLPYLLKPETIAPFTRLFTYLFMIIGIIPTILVIIYTSFFCTTSYPAGIVLYTCFGSPFALEASSGFLIYSIASLVVIGLLYYITRPQK